MSEDGTKHLRLVWPQWQGAGTQSVREMAAEFPFDAACRGYAVGSRVLEAVLPEHSGPSEWGPVEMGDAELEECDGVSSPSRLSRIPTPCSSARR